ncbi:MAG: OmpA family protein [Flavobacterium sp.]
MNANCQNLVPNGDFEVNKHFFTFRTLGSLSNWFKINSTTPDFCESPYNIGGYQKAFSGAKYCGIFLSLDSGLGRTYVEYISVKLDQKLIKDKNYCLSMYLSLGDFHYSIDALNFNFSKKKLKGEGTGFVHVENYGVLTYEGDSLLRDYKSWMRVCSNYQSIGGEQYLTIGYLNPNVKLIKVKKGKPNFNLTYYYIDKVSLIEEKDILNCDCKFKVKSQNLIKNGIDTSNNKIENLGLNKELILDDIKFETNNFELLSQSKIALNELIKYVKKGPEIKIEILGHTDNIGTESNNFLLSEKRAQSVAMYLINNGIPEYKIQYKGLGSKYPISTNENEDGRQLNRRVEIRILEE